ncbi:hypothetical protein [Streptomyces sp. 1-11]|uniref:hypothetical protein n=1 Tax=Streptomyces sp. 1-11 TaxID=2590549 RepID=UPI001168229E|nr:hypothetical protein [Streptomyces sp. 1-11]GEK00361.1 hypothetical protein TNCT1_26370 [Streptomyces sp. 1-11]
MALGDKTSPVAVLDDREDDLERACDQVEDLDLSVFSVLLRGPRKMDELLDYLLAKGCGALISDHRLHPRGGVDFDGARLVARANERGLPAILYSAYVEDDEATSIRTWRYGIPRIVKKGPGSTGEIAQALRVAEEEATGHRSLERRGFLTPITVVDVHDHIGRPTLDVTVTAWRPDVPVTIPIALLPPQSRVGSTSLIGKIYLGEVNFYAEHESDLFFKDLRLAPVPPSGWRGE